MKHFFRSAPNETDLQLSFQAITVSIHKHETVNAITNAVIF